MIVKILSSSAGFHGVQYNTGKIGDGRGELMLVANFGSLQGLENLKPQDYVNYLKMLSAQNKRVRSPQFHGVISAKGKTYDKRALTEIARLWLAEMGYGDQPYLIVFHKDTANNHVHMVSTRVGRDGRKINDSFEKLRAVQKLSLVLGYDHALRYNFSTRAQFYMLLERAGYLGKDYSEARLAARIAAYQPDKQRAGALKERLLHQQFDGLEFIFHTAEGKKVPYGYTIIDHEGRNVFKGSEVLPLRELLMVDERLFVPAREPVYVPQVSIADDVDDQQIYGMRRRRQKKAITNSR